MSATDSATTDQTEIDDRAPVAFDEDRWTGRRSRGEEVVAGVATAGWMAREKGREWKRGRKEGGRKSSGWCRESSRGLSEKGKETGRANSVGSDGGGMRWEGKLDGGMEEREGWETETRRMRKFEELVEGETRSWWWGESSARG